MIDNEQTEQIEELEDVVIDLAEDEGKQPEETSDTGHKFRYDNEEYCIINDDEVIAVVPDQDKVSAK